MTADSQNFVVPPAGSLFDPVASPRGQRLALVFGNEGPDGRCPFHGQQCIHCDIGAGEGVRFTPEMNAARLDYLGRHYGDVLPGIAHLVIYNYGSTLNDSEFSRATRSRVLAFARALPAVKRISFDSREQFVTATRIDEMVNELRTDQSLSITFGLESQDDEIRQLNLKKNISREQVLAVFKAMASRNPRTAVEMNVLFQPPGITGNDAVAEALATIEYGLELMEETGVLVDFNFHPYYPSKKGTKNFPDHPRAMLEHAIKALIFIIRTIKAEGGDSRVFVGWNDEGHDLQPTVRKMKQMLYAPVFASFNLSQREEDLHI